MDYVPRSRRPIDPRWRLLAARRANRGPAQHEWSQRWIAFGAIGLAVATAATAAVSAFAVVRSDEANREQQQITERGQINDRFTTATDQLASDKLEGRLGGIYALEQIMHDASANYEDPVIEILSAYVRSHAPRTDAIPAETPHIDIQAALTVLGRRPNADTRRSPDLARTSLRGADLSEANLNRANLRGADLTQADLGQANLTGANLGEADLARANLNSTNLNRANLTMADLTRANLTQADLTQANLGGAKLIATRLTQARLAGAYLGGAELTEVDLTRANLTWADLTQSDLTGANLTGANLIEAYFTGANLTGADLSWANLSGAKLTGANLTGANLTGANFTAANLKGVVAIQPSAQPRMTTTVLANRLPLTPCGGGQHHSTATDQLV